MSRWLDKKQVTLVRVKVFQTRVGDFGGRCFNNPGQIRLDNALKAANIINMSRFFLQNK